MLEAVAAMVKSIGHEECSLQGLAIDRLEELRRALNKKHKWCSWSFRVIVQRR